MSNLVLNMTTKGYLKMDERDVSLHRLGSDYHEKGGNGMEGKKVNVSGLVYAASACVCCIHSCMHACKEALLALALR